MTTKYNQKVLERILLGTNGFNTLAIAVDGHDRALELLESAAQRSAMEGGESLADILTGAEIVSPADQAIAALAVARYLTESPSTMSEAVTPADVLNYLEEMQAAPFRQRMGMARELRELTNVLKEQGAKAHALEDVLKERVVELEGNVRYEAWRQFSLQTRWCPSRESVYNLVKEELTFGDNLASYPLEPRRASGVYRKEFLERHFPPSFIRRMHEIEVDKDRLMIGALATLADKVGSIAQAKRVTVEDWEKALAYKGGANEWRTIYEHSKVLDEDFEQEIRGRNKLIVASYQANLDKIKSVLTRHPDFTPLRLSNISSVDEYEAQVGSLAKAYYRVVEKQGLVYVVVRRNNKIRVPEGTYVLRRQNGKYGDVHAYEVLTGRREVPQYEYINGWKATGVMEHLLGSRGVKVPNFKELTEVTGTHKVLLPENAKPIGNLGHFHPEFDKYIATRKLYHEHMAKRFASA